MLEIRLFGEAAFDVDGKRLKVRLRPKALSLLALLAVRRGEPVSRESLAAHLWPDDDERAARMNLRRHVHLLSKALPPVIAADASYLAWNPAEPAFVDCIEFERYARSNDTYEDAVQLYRGDFAPSVEDEWVYDVRESFRARYVAMLVELGERALRSGDFERAVGLADRLAQADEWREEAVRIKMTALYRLGNQQAALAAFTRFAESLRREMDAEPMLDTVSLYTAIAARAPLSTIDPNLDDETHEPGNDAFPFVGRSNELTRLTAAWSRAARGNGSAVFIQGEAGIGKSRLARQISQVARRQGGFVVYGSTSNPQAVPFQPLLTALRRGLRYLPHASIEPSWLSMLAGLLPEVHAFHPGLRAQRALDPHRFEEQISEALARAFIAIARAKPLVVVLEDLQWANESTVAAVGVLARWSAGSPVLVIGTYRTGDEHNRAFNALRRELLQSHRATIVPLAALAVDDFAAAPREGTKFAAVTEDSVAHAAQLGGGNPLFVTLLLHSYAVNGEAPSAAATVATVEDAINLRLRTLSAEALSVAQAGAVCGSSFEAPLLAEITGWTEPAVYAALDALIDAGIVRENTLSYEYTFTHALVAKSLYDGLAADVRALRHRRIAAALEARSDESDAAGIARHWERAGYAEQARSAYERASRHASEIFSWNEAVRTGLAAVKLSSDDRARFEALLLAVRASRYIGQVSTWREHLDALEIAAAALRDAEPRMAYLVERIIFARETRATDIYEPAIAALDAVAESAQSKLYRDRACVARASYLLGLGDSAGAEPLFRSLLDDPQAALPSSEMEQARVLYAQALLRLGDFETAAAAVRIVRERIASDDYVAQRELGNLEANVAFARQDFAEMERASRRLLELFRLSGDLRKEWLAHALLGISLANSPDDSREELLRSRELAMSLVTEKPTASLMATINLAELELRMGRFERAVTYARESLAIAREIGEQVVVIHALVNEAIALAESGCIEEALERAREAERFAQESTDPRASAAALIALGSVLLLKGETVGAIGQLERGVELRKISRFVGSIVDDLALLINAYLAAGKHHKALATARELVRLVDGTLEHQRRPTRICAAVARAFAACKRDREAADWIARGKQLLERTIERIADGEDRRAFRALSHNRYLSTVPSDEALSKEH